ncbi:E3 ubiquitin-protein ligase ZNRF3-like [Pyrus ussuriensis x Pyrus communis]|uniref:E3 ubiquitin-protein ligase ZNRF3-like n=1 Tax=Pyrus ussuriensis x Pyrus communis TaxID=2448454 RepID=A0A5N5F9G0_9ROSA|nr:E3 ubiquitin-protein ligase ZNRF3-like [Pyrus ussuriensis x Pyrus communis]
MAGLGRFPGVDLPPRRRKRTQRHEAYANDREPPPREWLEPSVNQVSSIDLDDAAHNARRRLEKRLGYHKPSSSRKGTASSNSKLLGGSRGFFSLRVSRIGNQKEGEREACGICLEDFEAEKQAVDLSCAHKFHSNCLLPWLHVHPDCPYCRTPVRCS